MFSVCSQPCNRVLQTGTQDSGKEEHGCTPAACGQSSGARERARSRSPQRGKDLRSWVGDTTDYEPSRGRRRTSSQHRDHTARDKAAPRPSNSCSESGPAPSAALEQTLPGQGDQSRSLCQGHGLHSRFMKRIDSHHSARRIRRRRARRPHRDRAPRDDAAAGPSNARCRQAATDKAAQEQTLLTQRERSKSPRRGYNLHRRFVDIMDHDPSAGRRRTMASVPQEKQAGLTLRALRWGQGQIVTLHGGGAQHLTSAVPQRWRNPGNTKSAPSREQAARRTPAAHPVPPPRAASGQEELRETLLRLGQL